MENRIGDLKSMSTTLRLFPDCLSDKDILGILPENLLLFPPNTFYRYANGDLSGAELKRMVNNGMDTKKCSYYA